MNPPADRPEPPALDESRLELALRASNEGLWDWHTHQREIYYSRRILEFLECGPQNAPNLFTPPHVLIHGDDRAQFGSAVANALDPAGPELLAIDCRVQSSGGTWRWLRIRGTVVRNRAGEAVRIAGSMIDISRRKAAEANIEEERHLLRMLIDHVPLQVFFKDLESRFMLVNRRLIERMGLSDPREIVGRHDRDFFGPEHWQEAVADERRIMDSLEPLTEKLERETWPGKADNWVVTSKFPWFDRAGTLKGTFGISSDVTDLVEAQQHAAALAAELAERNTVYEEEVQLAREIQQAFAAPAVPVIASETRRLEFAARYFPISGLAGDFFEIVPIAKDCAGLLVCDVMGHGVRSALVVSMIRGLLEKQRRSAADPSLYLRGLNRGLHSILDRAKVTMFATAFYAVIDLKTGTLRCACAGHPAAVLSCADGPRLLADERRERGPGLGLLPTAEFPTVETELRDGERLLIFTDGLIEAEDRDGRPFGDGRLVGTFQRHADKSLQATMDAIIQAVLRHADNHQFLDDVCLLAAELVPAAIAAEG